MIHCSASVPDASAREPLGVLTPGTGPNASANACNASCALGGRDLAATSATNPSQAVRDATALTRARTIAASCVAVPTRPVLSISVI